MNKHIFFALLVFSIASCTSNTPSKEIGIPTDNNEEKAEVINDTTPKVVGIGGIFFYADDVERSKEWYKKNLGIETNDWGSASFESRSLNNTQDVNDMQWKPFKAGDEYFAPSKKEFMINYIVQNLEGMVRNLKANGATILDTMETYDFGKFIHIMDEEGNKIELWEPISGEE